MPDKNLQLDKFIRIFPDLFMLQNPFFDAENRDFGKIGYWRAFYGTIKYLSRHSYFR